MKAGRRHVWGRLLATLAVLAAGGCGWLACASSGLGYAPGPSLTGVIDAAGAEAMGPWMTRLGEIFRAAHPGVEVRVDAGGPPRAPVGLAAGKAHIGFTGRTYWPAEQAAIMRAQGRPPLQFRVGAGAYDNKAITHTMTVVVPVRSSLTGLSLAAVRALFSSHGPAAGARLGLGGPGAPPLRLHTGKFGTGAAEYVRETAFAGGDWHPEVTEWPTDEQAVAAVAADPGAIALVGLGFVASGTRPLALRIGEAGPFHAPTRENVLQRRYPLARCLFFHVNAPAPGRPLDPLLVEFIRLALSPAGQAELAAAGYLPLPDEDLRVERDRLAAW